MIEKRKHPRYKASIVLKYKRLDDQLATWQDGPHLKNISLGGMLFSAYERIPVSAPLIFRLQIFTTESKTKIIELHAKVIAVDEGTVSYDTRVAFDELSAKTLAEFKQFIEYLA